jgi:hypothetical protein
VSGGKLLIKQLRHPYNVITKRKISNEGRDEWAYKESKNPAW